MLELQMLDSITNEIYRTLKLVLPPAGSRCAFLDYPSYGNVGDSLIWLGTLKCMNALGLAPTYVADIHSYDEEQLRASIGKDGTIIFQGGGNFGDLWQHHQKFRENVIRSFPDNKIIAMPQSVHFRQSDTLSQAKKIIDNHPDITILARDLRSFEFIKARFRANSLLCPDPAFFIGTLTRASRPAAERIGLLRTDKESACSMKEQADLVTYDWLNDTASADWLNRFLRKKSWSKLLPPKTGIYKLLSEERMLRGCRLLSRARVVVTDRLHGHILCLLMSIPHVLIDNENGKLSSFSETWTSGNPLTYWADSLTEAIEISADIASALSIEKASYTLSPAP